MAIWCKEVVPFCMVWLMLKVSYYAVCRLFHCVRRGCVVVDACSTFMYCGL
uniref:Uncharacterized protein n=1 Tax=Aegilops tauschii subsp. strangulata TaxID=200361 RepID=A0A453MPE4_AEGTS